MGISNIVVVEDPPGTFTVDFDSDITDYNLAAIDFGPTSAYGTRINLRGNGGHYVGGFESAKPFHFQATVSDYSDPPVVEQTPDQLYPVPTLKPASYNSLLATPTGSTSNRLTWAALVDPSASFQIYRAAVNNFSMAAAIGAPLAPGTSIYNDYALTPGTQYYYWLAQVN